MSIEQLVVGPEQQGERLDVVLAELCGSRARAQRAIAADAVTVDGVRPQKRLAVQTGQTVSVDLGALVRPAAPFREDAPTVPVIYQDEHLLVIDKPAGLVVHSGAGHDGPTLVDAVAGLMNASTPPGGDPERPGIVHRLDRDTSGLLLVARSDEAHRLLQQAIRDRDVTREYLALVDGRPDARSGTIDAPLGRDRHYRTRQSIDTDTPRRAVTHFEIEQALPRTTLLRVRLETGRTHQIRAHFKAIGLPVAGDPDYGRQQSGVGNAHPLGLRRQFLHAARLSLVHPITGEPLEVTSELPADLAQALQRARSGN